MRNAPSRASKRVATPRIQSSPRAWTWSPRGLNAPGDIRCAVRDLAWVVAVRDRRRHGPGSGVRRGGHRLLRDRDDARGHRRLGSQPDPPDRAISELTRPRVPVVTDPSTTRPTSFHPATRPGRRPISGSGADQASGDDLAAAGSADRPWPSVGSRVADHVVIPLPPFPGARAGQPDANHPPSAVFSRPAGCPRATPGRSWHPAAGGRRCRADTRPGQEPREPTVNGSAAAWPGIRQGGPDPA